MSLRCVFILLIVNQCIAIIHGGWFSSFTERFTTTLANSAAIFTQADDNNNNKNGKPPPITFSAHTHYIMAQNAITPSILADIFTAKEQCDTQHKRDDRNFGSVESNYKNVSGHLVIFLDDCVSDRAYQYLKHLMFQMLEYMNETADFETNPFYKPQTQHLYKCLPPQPKKKKEKEKEKEKEKQEETEKKEEKKTEKKEGDGDGDGNAINDANDGDNGGDGDGFDDDDDDDEDSPDRYRFSFCKSSQSGQLTSHEIGHNWQDMIAIKPQLEARVYEYIGYMDGGGLGWHVDENSILTMVVRLDDNLHIDNDSDIGDGIVGNAHGNGNGTQTGNVSTTTQMFMGGRSLFRFGASDTRVESYDMRTLDAVLFPSYVDHMVTRVSPPQAFARNTTHDSNTNVSVNSQLPADDNSHGDQLVADNNRHNNGSEDEHENKNDTENTDIGDDHKEDDRTGPVLRKVLVIEWWDIGRSTYVGRVEPSDHIQNMKMMTYTQILACVLIFLILLLLFLCIVLYREIMEGRRLQQKKKTQ